MVSPKHKILIRYCLRSTPKKRYGVSEHKHSTVSLDTNIIQCFHAYETQTRYSVSKKQLGTVSQKHKHHTVSLNTKIIQCFHAYETQTRYSVSETQLGTVSLKHKYGTVSQNTNIIVFSCL